MVKVCFVTLSRSDYSSLKPVISAAFQDHEFHVDLVAGGSHLLTRFGPSINEVEADGFAINFRPDFMLEDDNSDLDMARAFGRAVPQFVEYFASKKPDCVFVLGDRWEMLAVAHAASFLRIPIVHHSGGDITQGSLDNQTRYILSTLAHLHLVALDEHRDRLVKMGEEEWRVKVAGEPALSEIKERASAVANIWQALGLRQGEKFVLATYHPTSFENLNFEDQISTFLTALDDIDLAIVLTAPNPDPGSQQVLQKIRDFAKSKANLHVFENLGSQKYYAAMAHADYMIGNSSSGIWEAPSFKLPVLNIGVRQKDRRRGLNVVDVDLEESEIRKGIEKVSSSSFREKLLHTSNPYVRNDTIEIILSAIKAVQLTENLLFKKLQDPL